MRKSCHLLSLVAALTLVLVLPAHAQDDSQGPSLGDVARQARIERQQKDAPTSKDAQPGAASATEKPTGSSQDALDKNPASKDPQNTGAQSKITVSKDATTKDSTTQDTSAKAAGAKPAKKVITNEEISSHSDASQPVASSTKGPVAETSDYDPGAQKNPPEYWKSRILSQKNLIASLKNDIDSLSASIQYAPGNCVSGCVEWNERQQQKQQQVDGMKVQLQEQEKQLEEMQEAARKQGYGNSVYDP
jgi:hypothetical protein